MNEHDPARENLCDWLRNAHAMEMQAESMLKGQASRLEHHPQVKARALNNTSPRRNSRRATSSSA
jgi:ferritin-like metal-binding protein YciE